MRLLARLLALALLVAALPAPPSTAAAAAASGNRFTFARLNRTYQDVAPELLPFESGALSVGLSSPRSVLAVRNHLLRLEPGAGGSHAAELSVEFQGSGRLVADVDLAGFASRLQDDVTVPAQRATLEGRVRLARTAGGYLVTPEQLPRTLSVRIQSRLGAELVDLCERLTLLPGTGVACTGLDRAFSTAVVPLPRAGEAFLLADEELTPTERAQLDRYLSPSANRAARP